jgi:hypothetical protein
VLSVRSSGTGQRQQKISDGSWIGELQPPELLRWNIVVRMLLVFVEDLGGTGFIARPFRQMMHTMME